jgi:anti-anti-sigma factor
MTIEMKSQGTTVEMKLTGWLDTQSAPMLEEEVNALDSSVTGLILDCAGLEYLSSAGLRQLVAMYKKMNGNLTLRNVSDEIMNVIRITGLDKRMKFE